MWGVFPAEFFAALVAGIADRDHLDSGVALQRWQMTLAHNCACANDSDPQLLVIFVGHEKFAVGCNAEEFDLTTVWGRLFKNLLTAPGSDGSLRDFFEAIYVKSLQHYRIETGARQYHSPSRHGEEEGRCRPSRDEKCTSDLQSKFAPTPNLGAGTEKVRPPARNRAGT